MWMDTYTSTNMILLSLFIRLLFSGLFVCAKAPSCCSGIQNEKCRAACGQVSAQASSIPQIQLLLSAAELCPPDKVDFWQCINESLPAVKMMSSWPEKTCCDLARGKECRRRCNMAETKDSLTKFCKEIAEPSLFGCIQRQEAGSQCCNTTTSSCGIVCRGVYVTGHASTRPTRILLSQHCSLTDKHVAECVHKQWHPKEGNPLDSLHCCEKAQTSRCRSTCRNVLHTVMSEDDRVDEVIQACSQPQPTDPLWQCFLNSSNTRKNETILMSRIDNAKLQCCGKASSSRCRELCAQTYKGGWSLNAEFESTCSYMQPVSTVESNLHNCLTDVDQPCKLGCSGLSFCTNFNNRPTELFRSCTVEADHAAQMGFNSWKNGVIHLPQMTIPVKDISHCKPAMWKAIACALEIRPCGSQQSLMTLCKEDCLFILTKCVDASSLSGDKTVPVLCNALPSKNIAGSCVSLDSYLYESPIASKVADIRNPCNPNPCPSDDVCLVRRWRCKHADDCLPYVCHKACPLGQKSKVRVPTGVDVRLINLTETPGEEDCYLACHCGSHGHIENCKHLTCLRRDSCFLGHSNTKEHGQHFSVNGNACVCNAGRVLCTRNSCQPDNHSPLLMGNPSNCPTNYQPVCGSNGKTYPNVCMARCAGISNIIANTVCSEVDACSQRPCPAGFKCVPHHHVCLNDMPGGHSCPQFQCVDEGCTSHGHDPVCSSSGEEFSNICQMFSHRRTLGYWGHCQSSCSDTGVVCGQNGETYKSKCAALAARVSVDYFSKCQAFGNLTAGDSGRASSCGRVKCPPMFPSGCHGVVPPGACCPICAAQMRLLWDSRLMTAAASHMKQKVVSVMDVLKRLSEHISVLECDVSGYVSVIGELIIIIGSVVTQPTALQVEACQSEAKRIHSLLKMGSPNIVSYLAVSPLVFSELELSSVSVTSMDPIYTSDPFRGPHSSDNSSCSRVTNVLLLSLCAVFALMCCLIQRVRLKL